MLYSTNKAYLPLCQTSMMEIFELKQLAAVSYLLTYLLLIICFRKKSSIADIWQGPKYVSVY